MGLIVNTVKATADGIARISTSAVYRAAGRLIQPLLRPPHARCLRHKQQKEESKCMIVRESTTPSGAAHASSSSNLPTVELLLDLHTDLGEAPTWDERTQRLWFVDINNKKIYSCTEDGKDLVSIDTPETVGTIALTTDKNVLLAAMNRSVCLVNVVEQSVGAAIATVPDSHGLDEMRFNDGKATPGGALVVGRMHMRFAEGEPGRLYRLHWEKPSEGRFEELVGPDAIGLPNGLVWDRSQMLHADTYHRTITAYPTDAEGVPLSSPGQAARGQVAVKVPSSEGGGPDGMCISREGNLWVAIPEAGCIICYSPQSGKEVLRVKLPVKNPTCTTFGGANLDKIFVTSMREEGPDASEHWGGLFVVHVPGELGMAPADKVKIPA